MNAGQQKTARQKEYFRDTSIKSKDSLVWSDAATRNGAIITVDAGISLAFLTTSASLVRNVNYFTASYLHYYSPSTLNMYI